MQSITKDSEGAVMVMAVFMAMIAIGALYYLTGIGSAILAQERMQDAADATAFSSAVIHARGMNLLALTNIIMASLLAILVLLSMLSSLFTVGVVILAAVSWFFPPAATLIPVTNAAARGFSKAEGMASKAVNPTIKALHTLQGPLNRAVPALASLNAAALSNRHYGKVVRVGITYPVFSGLPTREGDFDDLCNKAGELAGEIAALPITSIFRGMNQFIADRIADRAKSLGGTYASFYCGSGPKPKPPTFKEKVSIPEIDTPESRTCKETKEEGVCKRYEEQVEKVGKAYDASIGECTGPKGTETKLLCDRVRRKARTDCNIANSSEPIYDVTWVERRHTRVFTLEVEGDDKFVKEHNADNPQYTYDEEPKTAKSGFKNGVGYVSPVPCFNINNLGMTKWDESRPITEPLCETKDQEPSLFFMEHQPDGYYEQEVLEVRDVLRCTVKREFKAEFKGEAMDAEAKKGMAPQEMCSCAAQGEESFQVRSVVLGKPDRYTRDSDQGILVANQGHPVNQSAVGKLAQYAGVVAAAQAEYYFDDAALGPEEWLWHLKWKARMRRLTFGRKAYECPVKDNCSKTEQDVFKDLDIGQTDQDQIGAFRSLLEQADNVIVH